MANPHKGEIAFLAGGVEYTFRLGTYAMVILERRTKMPVQKFLERPKMDWGAEDMLSLFYAGLYQHHKLSDEQVADIMDDLGADGLGNLIVEAMAASGLSGNPTREGANGSANPPEARAGIGTVS